MNVWMRTIRDRRRDALAEGPDPAPFAPVDDTGRREFEREIEARIARLVPDGLDEGSLAAPYDQAIRDRVKQWIGQIDRQLNVYQAALQGRIEVAEARLQAAWHRHEIFRSRLEDAKTVREAVVPAPPKNDFWAAAAPEPDGDTVQLKPTAASEPSPARRNGMVEKIILAGRSRATWFYLVALVVALGADVVAFYQIMKLAIPENSESFHIMMTAAISLAVVFLAHMIGVSIRHRAEEGRWRPGGVALGMAVAWLGLGVIACYIRLTVEPLGSALSAVDSGGFSPTETPAAPTEPLSTGPSETMILNAILFAALYLVAGIIAASGAYALHDPAHARYSRVKHAYEKACLEAEADAERLSRIRQRHAHLLELKAKSELIAAEERVRLALVGDELQNFARHKIAEILKDPAMTDALFRSPPLNTAD
ncbi:hypothetical protein [Glycomyces rhizosphaerae]|uniref:Uncharacterized protein n=1 Tax=Glycomyces rhizosphaerae TaxID=2054422 RepID=A0ABV7PVV4_9ACTN